MVRRIDDLTEQEARERLSRRKRRRAGDPYRRADLHRGWWLPGGYGYDAVPATGYAWPVPPYPFPEHGVPDVNDQRDWMNAYYGRGRLPRDVEERDMLDRAGDELASWFGDDAAEARREEDHRGRGPKTYVRSDIRVEEDVNDTLTDDPDVDATDIEVSVKDREVTLNGKVDSRRAKRVAEDCADSVSGVVHVQNNLRVEHGKR